MNSNYGYMHNYCNKIVYIHIFIATNLDSSQAKICIYVHFVYFRLTDVSALTYIPLPSFWLPHQAQRKLSPLITPKTHENPSFSPFLVTKYIYHLKLQINLSKKTSRQQPITSTFDPFPLDVAPPWSSFDFIQVLVNFGF